MWQNNDVLCCRGKTCRVQEEVAMATWEHGIVGKIDTFTIKNYTQMTHGYLVGLMIFKNGCKKSKICSKMRLKSNEDPHLPQTVGATPSMARPLFGTRTLILPGMLPVWSQCGQQGDGHGPELQGSLTLMFSRLEEFSDSSSEYWCYDLMVSLQYGCGWGYCSVDIRWFLLMLP